MLDTVWRISEKNFNVDNYTAKFGFKDIANIFREGEKNIRKKVNTTSGLNILISENINPTNHVEEINQFIKSNSKAFEYLVKNNIPSTINIGCTVGSNNQFTKSVIIPPKLTDLISVLNILLEFSAYPALDYD